MYCAWIGIIIDLLWIMSVVAVFWLLIIACCGITDIEDDDFDLCH